MILTITAAYDVWTNDFYQNNEALVYSFGIIVHSALGHHDNHFHQQEQKVEDVAAHQ